MGDRPAPPWDGKCAHCRKLMSRCMCFQERADRLADQRRPALEIKADQRPLYNALRQMHRRSAAPFFAAPPPPTDAARRDRTQSHDLPPRRQRDAARLRLLSAAAASSSTSSGAPPPKLQAPRAPPAASLRRPSSAPSDLIAAKRASVHAAVAIPPARDAPARAGESFDSDDGVWEL